MMCVGYVCSWQGQCFLRVLFDKAMLVVVVAADDVAAYDAAAYDI